MSIFSRIPVFRPKRSVFDLSHAHKFSTQWGKLCPILCTPVVPGDKFKVDTGMVVRLAPMVAPVMHQINAYVHYFYVPNRILVKRDYWEKFITGGKDGSALPHVPRINLYNTLRALAGSPNTVDYYNPYFGGGSVADFLGIKFNWHKNGEKIVASGTNDQEFFLNIFPFLAYRKIFADYYRDENFDDEAYEDGELMDFAFNGTDFDIQNAVHRKILQDIFEMRYRSYKKDYFTSALQTPQRGQEVSLSLAGEAPVNASQNINVSQQILTSQAASLYYVDNGQLVPIGNTGSTEITQQNGSLYCNVGGVQKQLYLKDSTKDQILPADVKGLTADLSQASSVTINTLRRAEKLQQWFETNARAGYRYAEQLLAHFGVYSRDASLQRAQYLGGGRVPVQISDVVQTSAGQGDSAQGNMAGYGYTQAGCQMSSKTFDEHGYLMAIFSVLPRTEYMSGIDRDLLKSDRYDMYWPEFAHLGEQEIDVRELAPNAAAGQTFGYTPRYAEYKFMNSKVSGEFRSPMLDEWHLARGFDTPPVLSEEFLQCNATNQDWLNRIFAVTSDEIVDHFYVNVFHQIKAVRPMPYFGVPHL